MAGGKAAHHGVAGPQFAGVAVNAYQAAWDLADEMIPVFPCNAEKKPICDHGFHEATLSPSKGFWRGAPLVGMPTGAASGWDVLDLDWGKGGEAWWEANKHRLPATRVLHTRSGGRHLYFCAAPGLRSSQSKIAPGVDVRGEGGYAIVWRAAGLPWDDLPVVEWPAWLLDLARGPTATKDATAGGDHSDLAAPSVAKVVALLDRMPNPVTATRDVYVQVMLAAVGAMRGLAAVGVEDDEGLIREGAANWAERWENYAGTDERARWDDDFAGRDAPLAGWQTLQAVAGRLIPGYSAEVAANEFGAVPLPVEVPAPQSQPRKLFVSRDFKLDAHQAYVIKHLVAPGNVCALLGQPGAGKSTLAPHLAYAVAQGRPVFGLRTTPGRTLYVAAEDVKGIQKRMGALGARHGHTDDCAVVESGNLRELDARAELAATVAQFKPALIVLDTVAAAFAGMDENTSQDMGAVVDFARRLAATGAAVLLVHHPAKQGDGSPRGHSVLNGTLDMVLTLAPDDVTNADTVVRGHTPKNRNGTTGREFAFRKDVLTLGTDHEGDPVTTTLPVELDVADAAAKPVELSDGQQAALGALVRCMATDAATAEDGAPAVPEEAWMTACATLSTAETPKDRARSARRMRRGLVEKGAVHAVGAMFRPVAPVRGASHVGTKGGPMQAVEFIEGDRGGPRGTDGTRSPTGRQ